MDAMIFTKSPFIQWVHYTTEKTSHWSHEYFFLPSIPVNLCKPGTEWMERQAARDTTAPVGSAFFHRVNGDVVLFTYDRELDSQHNT